MKLFSGKCPFFIGGTLLAAALGGAVKLFGARAGLLDAMKSVGNHIGSELSASAWGEMVEIDWQIALLIGVVIGAFLVTLASGNFRFKTEGKILLSLPLGMIGGFLVMTGCLISGESFFGHLAGSALLASGSWIFLGVALISAVFLSILFSGNAAPAAAAEKTAGAAKKGERK